VEEIFALYWTDPEFLTELSNALRSYVKKPYENNGFFVAEEKGEVLGIAGFKELASYLKPYAQTDSPVELYVIAVKYKRKGIGEKLKLELIESVQGLGFSEILLFSPNSHSESWDFHNKHGFERAGEVTPSDDEIGQVWQKIL